jgi:hypothetical protein
MLHFTGSIEDGYEYEDDFYMDEPDVDERQEQNDFAHDDDFPMEDQHLDGMYEE